MTGNNIPWYDDGFVAQASHYDLRLHRTPEVDVGEWADDVLREGDWSTLLAYLLRRFGPPNTGSDDDREIARWIITTPMEGVHVSAFMKPEALRLIFHVDATRDVLDRVFADISARRAARRDRVRLWSISTYGDEPPHWGLDLEGLYALDVDVRKATETEQRARLSRFYLENPDEDVNLTSPLTAEIQAAGERTVQDLLRTVSVRDQDINATGLVDGSDLPGADRYENAGRWLPPHAYTEDMTEVLDGIERLGGGVAGLARLADLVRREVPDDGHGVARRATDILRRIIEVAPADGNSRPHPSEYWAGIVAARNLLSDIEGTAQ